jgi:hypothetical protein
VIPADVHQPDEPALSATRNRKCASKIEVIELPVILLAGDFLPVFSVHRRLDKPGFRMKTAPISPIRPDCVICWHNRPLLEIVQYPIVPPVWNAFFLTERSPLEMRVRFQISFIRRNTMKIIIICPRVWIGPSSLLLERPRRDRHRVIAEKLWDTIKNIHHPEPNEFLTEFRPKDTWRTQSRRRPGRRRVLSPGDALFETHYTGQQV